MNFNRATEQQRNWFVGIALFVLTLALYWPVMSFPFVNYDDQLYVYNNPQVTKGLAWSGIEWAFTAVVAANWHPLTLISHMADCSMYHLEAGGHHFTNILFHSANVVLLWFLIRRMTGNDAVGALVAVLFALHPLNVQSVAWISERKNVLSTFFFFLTLLSYLSYAENPRPARYVLALVLFALGLLGKPMLVTTPFLLLLLDYWPLQRIFPEPGSAKPATGKNMKCVLLEKIPFLMLAAADCVITYLAQIHAGSIASFDALPVAWRVVNVPVAYLMYLEKTFWPTGLCILYPYRLPIVTALISVALIMLITIAAWHWKWKYRWFPVGWLWFLGTLVPVIGLVQTGVQSWADRHAYVPLIGIFLIVACILNECWEAKVAARKFIVLAVGLFLFFCVVLTRQQIGYWQSSVALFSRAIAINPDNDISQEMLGKALNGEERFSEAAEHFEIAARLRPQADEQYNLGMALIDSGQFTAAIGPLEAALKHKPDDVVLHNMLGVAFMQTGDAREAEKEFSRAATIQPDYAKSYFNLGKTFLIERQPQLAITNFMTALRLQPNWPEAMENLAGAYAVAGDLSNAVSTATTALKMAQTNSEPDLAHQIGAELNSYEAKPGH